VPERPAGVALARPALFLGSHHAYVPGQEMALSETFSGACRGGPLDGQGLNISQPEPMVEIVEVLEHSAPPLRRVGHYEFFDDAWHWNGWSTWHPVDTWVYVESEKRWLRHFA
jgi:hypothetical protein